MDDMLSIAERLNEVAAYANQPHVRQFLDSRSLDQPASRRLAALAALKDVVGTKEQIWLAIVPTAKTAAMIANETGIAYQTITVNLGRLVEEGRAVAVGPAPTTRPGRAPTLYAATGWTCAIPADDDDLDELQDEEGETDDQ